MKENNFFLAKKELKFLVWVIGTLLIFINFNYIYGWIQNNAQFRFQGFLLNLEDQFLYLSLMRQAREGHFFFTFLYSAEQLPALIIQPLFLFLGIFSSIFPPLFVYHVARNILSVILVILLYGFIGYFIENISYRRWTLIFLIFTSGWGYYFKVLFFLIPEAWGGVFKHIHPIELSIQDSSIFFMFYLFPHLLVALIFMICIFFLLCQYAEFYERKKLFYASAITFLLGFFHLYDVITIYVVSGGIFLWSFFRTKNWRAFILDPIIFYILSLPPMVYQYWVVTQYPAFRLIALTPLRPIYFFGLFFTFGIFSFFVLGFFWKWHRGKNHFPLVYEKRWKFLALWILVDVPLVLYAPFPQHQRLILGLQIPVVILGSIIFFYYFLPKIKTWRIQKKEFIFGVAIIIFLTHIFSPLGGFFRDAMNIKNHQSYFYPADFRKDLEYIDTLNIQGTILSAYVPSEIIPHFTGNRVYQGHWSNTFFLVQKNIDYKLFFSSESSNAYRKDFLKKYKISYILPTEKEREKFANFKMTGIEKVYSGKISDLYEVSYDLHAD